MTSRGSAGVRALQVICLNPAWVTDASIPIAACRAGAVGMLDLEYAADSDAAWSEIKRLERFTSRPFGLKFDPSSDLPTFRRLFDEKPDRLGVVLLAGGASVALEDYAQRLGRLGVSVLVEAIDVAEIRLAQRIGAAGVVLKGHEAGGRVGGETAFVLLQQWHRHGTMDERTVPAWVQGGIGFDTAAACQVSGATGVVLDNQLLLSRESPLDAAQRSLLAAADGNETVCLGETQGQGFRFYHRPNLAPLEALRAEVQRLTGSSAAPAERRAVLHRLVRQSMVAGPQRGLWPLGQDGAFAPWLAERFGTVASIVRELVGHAGKQAVTARRLRPLAPGSPLAVSHGTHYPILQGPMTRVSDTTAFAEAVADAGALPFLALALMRGPEAERLVRQTKTRLGNRPWGVGILGFVSPEIRREQLDVLRTHRPPFALIAGGRPDQARELEEQGIPTYLHVPSPGLLRLFLRDGARRFVFEGRECGGHVGPRTSFVLWELMGQVLREHIDRAGPKHGLHIVFAGGIHDGTSARIISALAAGLAERGVAVGVLMGTAYLFTKEAVASGAIVPEFQHQALGCRDTVLLHLGPGHEIRCVPTPFVDTFEREKRRIQSAGGASEELRDALDGLIVGRLRIASKGIRRGAAPGDSPFTSVSPEEQRSAGMYMIGQVAALRDRVVSMAELHAEVSGCGTEQATEEPVGGPAPAARPCDVAVIGMACFLPGAADVRAYWENLLRKTDVITEVPATHWDWRLYYDPNPQARGKTVSKWGGFLADVPFEPARFGMPPNSLQAVEPVQLLLLEATHRVLADAGYGNRPFPRERTSVVVGIGGAGPLSVAYCFGSYLPMLEALPAVRNSPPEVLASCQNLVPELTEDSFPGVLQNVAAGRIANRFDFGGANFAVDAACGSSLAAVYAGIRELESGASDLVVVAGADTAQNPFTYTAFSKSHVLSPRGRCSPFDESADGIVISEGVGVVLLKRLADAERDGDPIYCVIKGVGASSDGRCKGLTAPRLEGQLRALRRAYEAAGVSPQRVGLVEAHATGTVLGDQTELQALTAAYTEAGAEPASVAVGSVKSMIGHTKCAAGLAGLMSAALGLHHKILPPVLVQRPRLKTFEGGPFFLNTEPRPWVHDATQPRCAGVSAFGFGGTNYHAVLEEYDGDYRREKNSGLRRWPAELFVWRKATRSALMEAVKDCLGALDHGARPDLGDLAASLWRTCPPDDAQPTLAIVAESLDDLRKKAAMALKALGSPAEHLHDPRGFYFAEKPAAHVAKMAFLFPGQGSQYVNMLAQPAMAFGEVREVFDRAERVVRAEAGFSLARFIFPPSTFTPEQEQEARRALMRTDVAQPAVGAASLGMRCLLEGLGLRPDFLAGHSYGEFVALAAAGALPEEDLIRISHQRGGLIQAAAGCDGGRMASIEADQATVTQALVGVAGVAVANVNGPTQTVISGTAEGIQAALQQFKEQGIRGQIIPVSCAFHSFLVAPAREPLARALAACRFTEPRFPVFSNVTAKPYPASPDAIRGLLLDHLTAPVQFQAEIAAMYAAGARVFIEVGPQGVLTNLVGRILGDRPHLALSTDGKGRPGLVQLQHVLGRLLVEGLPVRLDRLYQGRGLRTIDLARLGERTEFAPGTWLVNSTRVRPCDAPEPRAHGGTQTTGPREPSPDTAPAPSVRTMDGSIATNGSKSLPFAPRPAAAKLPAPPPISGSEATDAVAQVMMRYQDLMQRFLDTQRGVMQSFLQGSGSDLLTPPSFNPNDAAAPEIPLPPPAPQAQGNTTTNAPAGANGKVQAATTPPAQVPPSPADPGTLAQKIVELISKRTGYAPEMLGLDLDLEADLGVDSIKRVEILGGLGDTLGVTSAAMEADMEKLMALKTIRALSEYLEKKVGAGASIPAPPGPRNGVDRAVTGLTDEVRRLRVVQVPAPLPSSLQPLGGRGIVVITDDGLGLAQEVSERLRRLGQTPVIVCHRPAKPANGQADTLHADLTDPRSVAELLDRIRKPGGRIRGLLHLLPRGQAPANESAEARMRREIKSLFLLAQGLDQDFRRIAGDEPPFVVAATALSGHFAAAGGPHSSGHGGVAGLLKSLAREWSHVRVRSVSTASRTPPPGLADLLTAELAAADGPVEVAYHDGRRVVLKCAPAPLEARPLPASIDERSVLLFTGGARGITAVMAAELARRFRPTLVLVGRSPLPSEESGETQSLTDPAAVKSALADRLRAEGNTITLAAIEAAYRRLCADREIRSNLAALRRTGASVHYVATDVRDDRAVARLLAECRERFGRIDGVIHGAGVIHDKRIGAKTPESYDAVFDTKVGGALTLCRHLKLDELKFLVFLGSVSGRYGNAGQTDYAAANEALVHLAAELDQRYPARVVTIAWGPWARIGMASELEPHFRQRGTRMIVPETGARLLVDELLGGRKGEFEIVLSPDEMPPASHESNGETHQPVAASIG